MTFTLHPVRVPVPRYTPGPWRRVPRYRYVPLRRYRPVFNVLTPPQVALEVDRVL